MSLSLTLALLPTGVFQAGPFGDALEGLSESLGLAPEIIGAIFGFILLMGAMILLTMFEVPPIVTFISMIVVAVLNIIVFLWPSWVLVLIALLVGVLAWREFSSVSGGANG